MNRVVVDTGPLIETFVPGARHHEWVLKQWKNLQAPFLTCEAVVSEVAFLLKREGIEADPALAMIERNFLKIDFDLEAHIADVRNLIEKVRNRPMSLADACLVRLTELYDDAVIFTLDDDFEVYRRNGSKRIRTLMPPR